ncbi:MAG TPA: UMP kinase [Gammaproteobacteria bacterium]|nr:UMP kinase [Gammaproteobacteria bacterium]
MSDETPSNYKRILLKLSGEALMGNMNYGIDPKMSQRLAREIAELSRDGYEIAVVVGGGNIFRGAGLADAGMDRVTGDHMGMLATVINALAMQDAIEKQGVYCRVMSGLEMHQVCEDYIRRRAIRHLEKGRVVIFGAGTGSPYFTTDSAGALRAVEIQADLMIKATKVDGVYDSDPEVNQHAVRYDQVTYDVALEKKLGVMDATAIVMCRDNGIPLRIFNIYNEGDLARVASGEKIGTLVVN